MTKLRFLLLEDSPLDVELICANLTEGGFEFECIQVQTRSDFLAALEMAEFDLILSDFSLPDFDGIAALDLARTLRPESPFIFVSATLGEELAIEALKTGATDYVLKQRLERLAPVVRRALQELQERRDRQTAQRDRRRAEADRDRFFRSLEQANLTLQTLIESSPLAIIFFNPQGIVKLWNQAAEHIFGWSADEVIGTRLPALPDQADPFLTTVERVLTGRSLVASETHSLCKEGYLIPIDLSATLIHDAEGNPGCLCLVADITERKHNETQREQAEQALQEHNRRLELLFETTSDLLSTPHPIALLNSLFKKLAAQMDLHFYFNFLIDNDQNRPMLRLEAYGGISQAEAEAIQWIEPGEAMCGLVAQQQYQVLAQDVQRSCHPNAQLIARLGIQAYAGQPLIVHGRLLGTLSFASRTRTHFTPEEASLLQATSDQFAIALERAELIASLQRQTEQLTQANQIKDEFLAILSHELRTPLNPILGWARLLQSRKLDDQTTANALSTIERSAKHQTQLIEDLLDVSRILQGKMSLSIQPVTLMPVIEAAIATMRLAAEAKAIDLRFVVNPPTSAVHPLFQPQKLQVLGDASRLQQVIWNLLSNAVKFTPMGGSVEVSMTLIHDAALRPSAEASKPFSSESILPDESVQIKVTDTGKGIDPAFLPHVFEYFRQEDRATTRRFGGLGLGLAIVRHIVELHGGSIDVESEGEGCGTSFFVQLPHLKHHGDRKTLHENLDRNERSRWVEQPLRGAQILVVDDESDSRNLLRFVLESSGAIVTISQSAQEALEWLAQSNFDVLISDIGMPTMDGYMLMRQVRSLNSKLNRKIPAIALTAYAGESNQQQALNAGFQYHLAKPIEPAILVRTLQHLLKSESTAAIPANMRFD